jgi:hypothetical protein
MSAATSEIAAMIRAHHWRGTRGARVTALMPGSPIGRDEFHCASCGWIPWPCESYLPGEAEAAHQAEQVAALIPEGE